MIAQSLATSKLLPRNRACAHCDRAVKDLQVAWLIPHPEPDAIPMEMRLAEESTGVLMHGACIAADIRRAGRETGNTQLQLDIEMWGPWTAAMAYLEARPVRWEEVTA